MIEELPESAAPGLERQLRHMRAAITLSRAALSKGNGPFGAVLVLDGREVLHAENTASSDRDPTAHAEMNLLSQLPGVLSPTEIARSVLYSSGEPCTMCSGAIVWWGISSVVFAASLASMAAATGEHFGISCQEIFERSRPRVRVLGPLLEDDAMGVFRRFPWQRSTDGSRPPSVAADT